MVEEQPPDELQPGMVGRVRETQQVVLPQASGQLFTDCRVLISSLAGPRNWSCSFMSSTMSATNLRLHADSRHFVPGLIDGGLGTWYARRRRC